MKRSLFLVWMMCNAFAAVWAQAGADNDKIAPGNVFLHFSHMAGNRPLNFDSTYLNYFGESFTIRKFRYYISNVVFQNTLTGSQYPVPDSYFLINEAVPASKIISFHIPAGKYNAVSFLLGVDSLKNVSGAQTGSLDPLNDMFWTWNSGYVMAKLEGASPASRLPHHMIEYHIGGYQAPYAVLQTVQLFLQGRKEIDIQNNPVTHVQIQADVNAWFHGTHDLEVSDNPTCTSIGQLAQYYSENYRQMFSVNLTAQP